MRKINNIKKEYDFTKGKRGPVISHKGKTRITIWIDTAVLEWFKNEAEREGQGYQTAMNQALRNYTKQDKRPIQEVVREEVRKELQRFLKPIEISDVLTKIIGRKPEVTKKLWRYIARNKLKDATTRKISPQMQTDSIFGDKKKISLSEIVKND